MIAYAVIPENSMKPISELFGFAADYIRENRLTIRMVPFIFLPFWPHHGEHENHLVMMIPVFRPGEEQDA